MLNGLPEVNRLLTFNLALTFLEVSGRYVKEQLTLSALLARSVRELGVEEAQESWRRTQRNLWGWGEGLGGTMPGVSRRLQP